MENSSWGVRELSAKMGVNHTIVYRVLATFEQQGFLRKNPQSQKYELGIKFLEYGLIIQENLEVKEEFFPVMERLKNETGESVFLTWLNYPEGICLSIAECTKSVRCAVTLGSRTPLYAGASAKVIMAFLSQDKQQSIIDSGLRKWTENTLTDPSSLLKNLKLIKQNQWSFSIGEYTDHVAGLAVPLFDYEDHIVASLTIGAPEHRMPKSNAYKYLKRLKQEKEQLQDKIKRYHITLKDLSF